jgi:hypothetical protein
MTGTRKKARTVAGSGLFKLFRLGGRSGALAGGLELFDGGAQTRSFSGLTESLIEAETISEALLTWAM